MATNRRLRDDTYGLWGLGLGFIGFTKKSDLRMKAPASVVEVSTPVREKFLVKL